MSSVFFKYLIHLYVYICDGGDCSCSFGGESLGTLGGKRSHVAEVDSGIDD